MRGGYGNALAFVSQQIKTLFFVHVISLVGHKPFMINILHSFLS